MRFVQLLNSEGESVYINPATIVAVGPVLHSAGDWRQVYLQGGHILNVEDGPILMSLIEQTFQVDRTVLR